MQALFQILDAFFIVQFGVSERLNFILPSDDVDLKLGGSVLFFTKL